MNVADRAAAYLRTNPTLERPRTRDECAIKHCSEVAAYRLTFEDCGVCLAAHGGACSGEHFVCPDHTADIRAGTFHRRHFGAVVAARLVR